MGGSKSVFSPSPSLFSFLLLSLLLTLNCRVILVDEMTLDKLDGKARLSDTTTADDHQLVLSHKLCEEKKFGVSDLFN